MEENTKLSLSEMMTEERNAYLRARGVMFSLMTARSSSANDVERILALKKEASVRMGEYYQIQRRMLAELNRIGLDVDIDEKSRG